MNCPKCGSTEFYLGLIEGQCFEVRCELFSQSWRNARIAESQATLKEILAKMQAEQEAHQAYLIARIKKHGWCCPLHSGMGREGAEKLGLLNRQRINLL